MLKKIGLAFLATLVVIVAYAAMQSPEYTVSREVTINAPAEKIFPYLNNMKFAEQWGPWSEIDPDAKMTLSGPEAGVGAASSWTGGKQLGTGSATITESIPNERVHIQLVYQEPMAMTQESDYIVTAQGSQSVVTWKVQGQNGLIGRIMCLFMDMDKTLGGLFEKGLSNLKSMVEKN